MSLSAQHPAWAQPSKGNVTREGVGPSLLSAVPGTQCGHWKLCLCLAWPLST